MIVTLHTDHLSSLEQIERFLDGTAEIDFRAPDRKHLGYARTRSGSFQNWN